MNALVARALEVARQQVGVRETTRNSGPIVNLYQARVGSRPGDSWCAAFAYWCFSTAATELFLPCPVPRTASVHRLWERAEKFRTAEPTVGAVFCIDHGRGLGHCGIVERVEPTFLTTIEGNTSPAGGREGDGVWRRMRNRGEVTLGYLDFSRGHETLGLEDTAPLVVA